MRMRRRAFVFSLMLMAVLTFGSMTSYAGQWIFDGPESWKWWYQNDDGSWTANDWQKIDGQWYYFGANGYMCVGWHQINGVWYWLDEVDGYMHTSGSWEGGYIGADGGLYSDYVEYSEDDRLIYYNEDGSSVYEGALQWKADWIEAMLKNYDRVNGDLASPFSYALPANWKAECPNGLISQVVQYVMDFSWGWDGSIVSYQWNIDDNHVFHMEYKYLGTIWD